ncbi:MAG: LamG-like jellyroll fold domain-containing protein, partial [Verrucomicrobiota bacterium]
MKTSTLLLALVCVLGITTAPGQTINLTHRYSFNGNANDLVGTANGTLQGGAIISNNALVLDGVNSYLALPANIATNYTAITLEAWVTDNGSGAWARIFDFGNNTADYMFLALPAGGGNLRGAYTTGGNGAEQVLQWPGGRPAAGQESHIV